QRIMEQTRIWYKARHPNVAKVHGWMLQVDDSGSLQACLISTWYPNGDITSYLLQHPEADREDLICNICWGLKHLHANDTVHGDLKPTNVMMGNRGIAILCDFGLSSFLHGASSSAFTGALHGLRSVRYTAPQLLEDNSVNPCSKEADIWAFGCVSIEVGAIDSHLTPHLQILFFQILSGQRPYNKIDDENDLCNKILDGEPAYTPDVFQRVKVKDIIKDCLKVPALKRPHVKALINVLAP
ncbi:kinase-like domain-containing protein, partial [Cantharellus anzutake]|uniref:kinase-like domain-containing protein n=1 Tax=Cantharellus anzutake TaxID=1750568 RepID=UPI001905ECAA